jgi:hypothetical protein
LKITKQDALDLLSKWQLESRLIHAIMAGPYDASAKVLGRIDDFDGSVFHLSAKESAIKLGEAFFLRFSIESADYEYDDAERATELLGTHLKLGYESVLILHYPSSANPSVSVYLAVFSPLEEIAKL